MIITGGAPASNSLLVRAADAILGTHRLGPYDRCATEYRGMSARIGESLSDDGSAVGTICGPMKSSFARLFERAQQEVPLRPDLTSTQLLSMVSALPKDAGTGLTQEPCLHLVLDGLRAQGTPLRPPLKDPSSLTTTTTTDAIPDDADAR